MKLRLPIEKDLLGWGLMSTPFALDFTCNSWQCEQIPSPTPPFRAPVFRGSRAQEWGWAAVPERPRPQGREGGVRGAQVPDLRQAVGHGAAVPAAVRRAPGHHLTRAIFLVGGGPPLWGRREKEETGHFGGQRALDFLGPQEGRFKTGTPENKVSGVRNSACKTRPSGEICFSSIEIGAPKSG